MSDVAEVERRVLLTCLAEADGVIAKLRHQAWCDAWLAIGLAAALAESEWGRASAEAGREWVAECVGRVVRRRK